MSALYLVEYRQEHEEEECDRYDTSAESPEELIGQMRTEFHEWVSHWVAEHVEQDDCFDHNNYPVTLTLTTPLVTETWTIEKLSPMKTPGSNDTTS